MSVFFNIDLNFALGADLLYDRSALSDHFGDLIDIYDHSFKLRREG